MYTRVSIALMASLFFVPLTLAQTHEKADLVAFSYNRPMQLYALLESIETHISGLEQKTIIYRVEGEEYNKAYNQVIQRFPSYKFIKQSSNPRADFKSLTMKATFDSPSKYVIFAVDDNIVKQPVNISECIQMLKDNNSYGFYLRSGKNITYNYSRKMHHGLPALRQVAPEVFQWKFSSGEGTWRYPNTVDMTIYKKDEIKRDFNRMSFVHPNSLEELWSRRAPFAKSGLCFATSKIIGVPLNIVNPSQNPHMNLFSVAQLLKKFNDGYKIDISGVETLVHDGPHVDYHPTFVMREGPHPLGDDKTFVFVVPSYQNSRWYKKNLNSIMSQTYKNFSVIYIDDASPDGTADLVAAYIKNNNYEDRITLIRNATRQLKLYNMYHAIQEVPNDHIILEVDGDDWLNHTRVLENLNAAYKDPNVWLTYGEFVHSNRMHSWYHAVPQKVVDARSFRKAEWVTSHLKTFYAGLFKRIRKETMMHEGRFFPCSTDMVCMYAMLEMAGHRTKYLKDISYVYNVFTPLNNNKVRTLEQREFEARARSQPRYALLNEYPWDAITSQAIIEDQ